MNANQANLPVRAMCRVLGVSVSGFYAWQGGLRGVSRRRRFIVTRRCQPLSHYELKAWQTGAPMYVGGRRATFVPTAIPRPRVCIIIASDDAAPSAITYARSRSTGSPEEGLPMFDRVIRHLSTAASRTPPRYVITLVTCVLVAFVWKMPMGHVGAAIEHPVTKGTAASVEHDAPIFDTLRREAASGDERSNLELSSALLDRYDLNGNSDDLYEALEWIDRRWDASGNAELAGRVVAHYCAQRVAKWHRLCVLGE